MTLNLDERKKPAGKFPLRLMPSIRSVAEEFSRREGVSLNQFINLAVAEKLAHLQHDQWLAGRSKLTHERVRRALQILDRTPSPAPERGDELPEGYRSIQLTDEYRRTRDQEPGD